MAKVQFTGIMLFHEHENGDAEAVIPHIPGPNTDFPRHEAFIAVESGINTEGLSFEEWDCYAGFKVLRLDGDEIDIPGVADDPRVHIGFLPSLEQCCGTPGNPSHPIKGDYAQHGQKGTVAAWVKIRRGRASLYQSHSKRAETIVDTSGDLTINIRGRKLIIPQSSKGVIFGNIERTMPDEARPHYLFYYEMLTGASGCKNTAGKGCGYQPSPATGVPVIANLSCIKPGRGTDIDCSNSHYP